MIHLELWHLWMDYVVTVVATSVTTVVRSATVAPAAVVRFIAIVVGTTSFGSTYKIPVWIISKEL